MNFKNNSRVKGFICFKMFEDVAAAATLAV